MVTVAAVGCTVCWRPIRCIRKRRRSRRRARDRAGARFDSHQDARHRPLRFRTAAAWRANASRHLATRPWPSARHALWREYRRVRGWSRRRARRCSVRRGVYLLTGGFGNVALRWLKRSRRGGGSWRSSSTKLPDRADRDGHAGAPSTVSSPAGLPPCARSSDWARPFCRSRRTPPIPQRCVAPSSARSDLRRAPRRDPRGRRDRRRCIPAGGANR